MPTTTPIEDVWAAKGNLPYNAIVATADGKYPALDGSLITNIAGSGDMSASVYDPNTVAADAFARANHTGTQTASTISDFDTEVSNNSTVAANTSSISLKAPINNPAFTGIGTIGAYNILTEQFIGLDIQAHSSILDATDASFTTAQAAEIAANTLKTGITTAQADEIAANTLKTGITTAQADEIAANTLKTGITTAQADQIAANTLKVTYPSADSSKLAGIATGAEVNTIDSAVAGEPSGSDLVLNVVSLTQAEYDAGTKIGTTLYIIT